MATSDRSRLTSRPDTRDDDATDVLLAILEGESRPEELLVAGDPTGRIADSLDPLGTPHPQLEPGCRVPHAADPLARG